MAIKISVKNVQNRVLLNGLLQIGLGIVPLQRNGGNTIRKNTPNQYQNGQPITRQNVVNKTRLGEL